MPQEALLARQAILDARQRVVAYELLFRPEAAAETAESDQARTAKLIANTVLSFGEAQLLQGKTAFVNFGQQSLLDDTPRLLPPRSTVIEILETVSPAPEVVEACRGLAEAGYVLALDDFDCRNPPLPLIPFASYIKADFLSTSRPELARLAQQYGGRSIRMLAEKVETREDFEWAANNGYELFQGYFFQKPKVFARKRTASLPTTRLQLLCQLQNPDVDLMALSRVIRQDVSLVYRVLRYVNSAALGLRREIRDMNQAVVMLGQTELRRILSLVVLQDLAGPGDEAVLNSALQRAALCERLSTQAGQPALAGSAFLTGSLSLLDIVLDSPMESILEELPVDEEVREALLGAGSGLLGCALDISRSFERGDWARLETAVAASGLTLDQAQQSYRHALEAVRELELINTAPAKAEAPVPTLR